ncbi:unnamed protein product [Effrenium voratum]|nr:unnamed protein product [Effrenium voratum]|mmetsp:Transcript_68790/g.163863  ORF Transcript_68790/g.163863 Transcript_68790/m.163863 type:complete len:348 (+) Transcript_68790:85-1128(+)
MRFLVAWDGSELSTVALRATIHVLARPGDQLLVYHVRSPGRYGAAEEFELEKLQARLAQELQDAEGLNILSQRKSGEMDEAAQVDSRSLMTVHQKEKAEAMKISRMIVNFAACTNADVLVMGSTGRKETNSECFQRTTLGSSAHLAALEAPCSVVLIRPGCRVDPKLATVFMVAVDGSYHSQYALQLCSEWARPDKDEIVCRVFGPAEFTEPVERLCTDQLQAVMRDKKVEYAVIPTELDESADVHGDDMSDAAQQCRFRQQAFLVFGARGRRAETGTGQQIGGEASPSSPAGSPLSSCASPSATPTTLGHVARWCIKEAQCSLIIARPRIWQSPTGLVILRAASLP